MTSQIFNTMARDYFSARETARELAKERISQWNKVAQERAIEFGMDFKSYNPQEFALRNDHITIDFYPVDSKCINRRNGHTMEVQDIEEFIRANFPNRNLINPS